MGAGVDGRESCEEDAVDGEHERLAPSCGVERDELCMRSAADLVAHELDHVLRAGTEAIIRRDRTGQRHDGREETVAGETPTRLQSAYK